MVEENMRSEIIRFKKMYKNNSALFWNNKKACFNN